MTGKNIIFYVVLLSIPILFFEILFRILPTSYPPKMLTVDEGSPIARYEANIEFDYSQDWNFAIHTRKRSNNYGYFHEADYETEASSPLLMVIGDSFVQANEVNSGESAAEILHRNLDGGGRVYSLGLSGAPLSQYVALADYARETFDPDGFVFFIIRNDFDESLFEYKSDPRFHYFKDVRGRRELVRVDYQIGTLKNILRHSALARYAVLNLDLEVRLRQLQQAFAADSDEIESVEQFDEKQRKRLEDGKVSVDEFLRRLPGATRADPQSILFVVDGMRPELYDPGTFFNSGSDYVAAIREYFMDRANKAGYTVIDMQPVFKHRHETDGVKFDFPTDLHWNQLGNRMVADEIKNSRIYRNLFESSATSNNDSIR